VSSLFVAICLIEKFGAGWDFLKKRKVGGESMEILIDVRDWKRFLWTLGSVYVTSRSRNDRSIVLQYHQDSTRWLTCLELWHAYCVGLIFPMFLGSK
jgi:hypothetical protein